MANDAQVKKTNIVNAAYRSCLDITHSAMLSESSMGTGKNDHGGEQLKPRQIADNPNNNWKTSSWYSPSK
jgi:hypothetical protein